MEETQTNRPRCQECHEPIPVYPNVNAGYVSPISDTYRPVAIEGIPGVENVAKIVCKECFCKDFLKRYPHETECPI